MSLTKNLQNAEYNARIRDEQAQNGGLTESEIAERQQLIKTLADDLEEKTGKTVALFNVKKHSKVKFAQMIQENIMFLVQNELLTMKEKSFLFDCIPLIGFKTNGFVRIENGIQFSLSQEEIAKAIKKSRKSVNEAIQSLIEKGVMARTETSLDDNNVLAYTYFMNPNIIFSGDKSEINDTLKLIFKKANKNKYLKNLPQKMI